MRQSWRWGKNEKEFSEKDADMIQYNDRLEA